MTLAELRERLGDGALTVLDVRTTLEFDGVAGAHCDPRQGHIPGAKRVQVESLFAPEGGLLPPERIRELVGAPEGAEIVAYCHSGSRSRFAAEVLAGAGYTAWNYVGSWHEWSREVAD